jgi:hypothetical protein
MAKIRRIDSKSALAQQRAELRRGARGKAFVGDDTGSDAARAAERAKVHRMQELQQARAAANARDSEIARDAEEAWQAERAMERERTAAHRDEPLVALFLELAADSFRLARTLVSFPFRLAAALRGHRASAADA